ncbi:MAG: Ig-like domain-containing protein, partial [Armatimonadota bacterium]
MATKLLLPRFPRLFWVFGFAVLLASISASWGALNLVASVPAHAQQGVSAEAPIVLVFNNPVFPGSVDLNGYPAVLSLQPSFGRGGAVVTFSPQLSPDGKTLTLYHSVPFEDNRTYLLSLNAAPSLPCLLQNNSARTPLTAGPVPHAVLFTVGDASAPEIVSHTPADGGMLEPGGAIRVVFSEMVVQSSLAVHSDPEIPFTVELSSGGTVMTAVPSPPAGIEPMTCRVWVEAWDQAGHPLASSDRPDARNPWVVTLLPNVPDINAPRVVHHIPDSSQHGVDIFAPIVLQFSEPIDIGSVGLPGGTAPAVRVAPNSGGAWSAEVAGDGSVLILKHSVPFVPAFQHIVTVDAGAVKDRAGNGLSEPVSFSFWTGEVTPPCILATTPVNGAVDVDAEAVLKLIFSEPVQAGSVKAELRRNGQLVLSSAEVAFSEDGLTACVSHPPLIQDGSEYELRVLSGADLNGNQLVEGALPGNVLKFRTRDLERPVLLSVEPGNGAAVNPSTASLTLTFSEAVGTVQDCMIKLWYLSGASGPQLDASCGEEAAPGTWRVRGGFSSDRKRVVLRFAAGTDGMPLRPGDTVVVELLAAVDEAGNQLTDGTVPRVWSFKVTDTTAPVLLELLPGIGEVVGLSAPVVIRTSKPLSTDHFRFEADGDWSQSATRVSGKLWKVARRAISSDGCTVTLRHEPFAEAESGTLSEHTFKIVSATDPLMQNLVAAPGVSFETRFYTARRPRIERVEYQAPLGGVFGQDGCMADPNNFEWRELPGPT